MYGPKHPERIKLNNQIKEWNTNRLDLFHITEPNESLEFYGVMRFFYQGDDLKYQTKCIRVSNTLTTIEVIEALIVKFHPDIKKLNKDKHALYENHGLEERKMKNQEHPLLVQLNWALDDKDGKFILKNESRRRRSTDLTNHAMLSNYGMSQSTSTLTNGYDSQTLRTQSSAVYNNSNSNFFSRRFSNSKKSKRKTKDAAESAEYAKRLAEEISGKPPESSFTRTISNPDDVMKRRRQKKLEFRLEQFSGVKGDGEIGGTLKIYGNSINPDVPYKTLLLSVNDTVERVLSETLDKYGVPPEEHKSYVLVQQNNPPREDKNRSHAEEIVLHYRDCPLGILVHSPPKRGSATFAVRKASKFDKFPISARVPPFAMSKNLQPTNPNNHNKGQTDHNQRQVSQSSTSPEEYTETLTGMEFPRLRKLLIDPDGSTYDGDDGIFSLSSLVNDGPRDKLSVDKSKLIKIGSQSSSVGPFPNILLSSKEYSDIRSVHCHITAKLDPQRNVMKLQLTPNLDTSSKNSRPCVLFVNQQRIDNSTQIVNGDIIQLGQSVIFRLEEFDDETESSTERSANEVPQDRFEDSSESLNPSRFTADLPVTVTYKYKKSKKLVDRIMKYSVEYGEKGSKDLFSSSSGNTDCDNLDETFRLSPAYMLYLVMRAGLCEENLLGPLIDSVAESFLQLIEKDSNNVEKEIFWLSNASELLHLLQHDSNLRNYSGTAEDVLAGAIEKAFFCVQQQFSEDLMILLPALLSDDDSDMDDNTQDDNSPCLDRASVLTQQGSIVYPIQHLLQTLSLAFNLFHNCQVNVALTIQMFSQLFHLLNTWMFNSVLGEQSSGQEVYSVPMCQEWGSRLTRRLNRIRYWSEINGLELAANCHLQKMYQVAELMEADKIDLNTFGEKCIGMINLNGAQLHHLLINCQDYELPDAWVEVVVNTAIQLHDQDFNDNTDSNPISQNKNTLSLYEDMDLRLPLLLPADGYCCDRGIVSCPTDLKALLNSLRDLLSYRLNPPTIDQVDIRWKSYLGSYETTPTVSRSNTLQEQTPSKLTASEGLSLPRNWIDNTEHSDELSTTETISSPRDRSQKKTNNISLISSQCSSSQTRQTSEKTMSNGNISNQKIDSKDRFELKLTKINNSLGLSIIAAKASPNDIFRIYVKDIVAGGAGQKCGKISQGDQLVSIDGNLLEDMTQDEAVAFMKKTKSDVALVIQKAAAQRDGVFDAILQAKNSKANSAAQKSLPISVNTKNVVLKQPPSKPNLLPKDQNIKAEPLLQGKTNRSQLPAAPGQSSKPFQRPPNRKTSNQETDVPEYSTLPLREHNTNLESSSDAQIYGTVRKQSTPQMMSGPSNDAKPSKSYSQPNLRNMIPRTENRRDSSSSESCSSASMSSTDEEESQKSQPDTDKRNSAPIYERISYPNEEKQIPSVPTKAVSDANISSTNIGIPRHEVTLSAMELRSNVPSKPLLSRPVLTQNSDPIISFSSQDESEHLSLNKPVSRDLSSASESESESETMSSNTESTSSSDPSPQPQKKLSSEPILSPRNSNTAIPTMTEIATVKSEQLPDRKVSPGISNLGGFKKPFKLTSKSNEQLSNLPDKESIISNKDATFSPTLRTNSKNKLILNEKPTLTIKHEAPLPFMSLPLLPPPPAASCLQYQPPTDLTEINWNNNSDVSTPKPVMNDEDIKLKRKAIAESIRQETEERERKTQSIEVRPPVLHDGKKSNERVSMIYGRPQFKESNPPNRPYSLLPTEQAIIPNPNDSDSNFPSPPSSILCAGLVVPPSPIMKAKLSKTDPSNKNTNSVISTNQTGVEELSFRDKMKLFASKIGDENVVERHKVSSKQRRIDSGDFS